MSELKFEWEYCNTCGAPFIRCPKCGNNSCNAGSGAFTIDGKRTMKGFEDAVTNCDVCDKAYEHQSNAYKCKTVPKRQSVKGGLNVDIINAIFKGEMWWQKLGDDKNKMDLCSVGNMRRSLLWNLRDEGLTDEEVMLRVNNDVTDTSSIPETTEPTKPSG